MTNPLNLFGIKQSEEEKAASECLTKLHKFAQNHAKIYGFSANGRGITGAFISIPKGVLEVDIKVLICAVRDHLTFEFVEDSALQHVYFSMDLLRPLLNLYLGLQITNSTDEYSLMPKGKTQLDVGVKSPTELSTTIVVNHESVPVSAKISISKLPELVGVSNKTLRLDELKEYLGRK